MTLSIKIISLISWGTDQNMDIDGKNCLRIIQVTTLFKTTIKYA